MGDPGVFFEFKEDKKEADVGQFSSVSYFQIKWVDRNKYSSS